MAQMVKNLLVMLETWVWFPGWEDPREKGITTHSTTGLENPMDRGA